MKKQRILSLVLAVVMVLGVVVVSVVLLFLVPPQPVRTLAASAKQKMIAISFFMIFLLIFVATLL